MHHTVSEGGAAVLCLCLGLRDTIHTGTEGGGLEWVVLTALGGHRDREACRPGMHSTCLSHHQNPAQAAAICRHKFLWMQRSVSVLFNLPLRRCMPAAVQAAARARPSGSSPCKKCLPESLQNLPACHSPTTAQASFQPRLVQL